MWKIIFPTGYLIGLIGVCISCEGNDFADEERGWGTDTYDPGDSENGGTNSTDFVPNINGPDFVPDVSACVPENTCQGKVAVGLNADCIADFGLGTNQAGHPEDGYNTYIGVYSTRDQTPGGEVQPIPTLDEAASAARISSCDSANDFAVHFTATGFIEWGAGLGIDWGGPPNASCNAEGAMECFQVYVENEKFALADAEADPRCQGTNAAARLDCLKRGKVIKQPKDLSAYIGIGFWILATDKNQASTLKVTFPIPETVRFYGGERGCSDDDGVPASNCFNDFYTTVSLNKNDTNKWVYKAVYFDALSWSEWWGLQLDTLGITSFPPTASIGLKFQVDAVDGMFNSPDFYIDDIIFLRN